jgi:hypothetical protein
MPFNHAFDFAFEVITNNDDPDSVTAAMLIAACRERLDRIEERDGGAEMLQAAGWFDSFEIEQ